MLADWPSSNKEVIIIKFSKKLLRLATRATVVKASMLYVLSLPDHWGPFQGQLLDLFADVTDDERGPNCRPKRGQKDETLHLGQL